MCVSVRYVLLMLYAGLIPNSRFEYQTGQLIIFDGLSFFYTHNCLIPCQVKCFWEYFIELKVEGTFEIVEETFLTVAEV